MVNYRMSVCFQSRSSFGNKLFTMFSLRLVMIIYQLSQQKSLNVPNRAVHVVPSPCSTQLVIVFIILEGVTPDRRPLGLVRSPNISLFCLFLFIPYRTNTLVNPWIEILLKLGRFCTSSMVTFQADDCKCTKITCTYRKCIYFSKRWPPLGIFGCMVQLFFYTSQDLPASHSCF